MPNLRIRVNGAEAQKLHQTCIGARLKLFCWCDDGAVADVRWHLAGCLGMIGDFKMEKAASRAALATQGDGETLTFCPCSTESLQVWVEATVNGKKAGGSLDIAVSAPEVITFSAQTDGIRIGKVDTDYHETGATHLSFGGLRGSKKPGIRWSAKLVGAECSSGSYAFVQLMTISRIKSLNGVVKPALSSNGAWLLDEDVFYGTTEIGRDGALFRDEYGDPVTSDFVKAAWPSESTMIEGEDSPATPLFDTIPQDDRFNRNFDEITVNEHFRTHLMFRPNLPESIWVSIARLDWFWQATATFTQAQIWRLSNVDWARDPVGKRGYGLPAWSGNRNDIMKD